MIRAHASELSCKQAHEQASQCAHGRVDINAEECERLSACSSARAGRAAIISIYGGQQLPLARFQTNVKSVAFGAALPL